MDSKPSSSPKFTGKLKEELKKAQWYLMEEEYQDAKKTLLDILVSREYSSDSYILFYWLGIACFGCNDITTAERYFSTALEKYPNHTISKLYLAVIAVLSGQTKEAIEYLLAAKKEVKITHGGKSSKYITKSLNAIKHNVDDESSLLEVFNQPYRYKLLPRFRKKYKRTILIRKTIVLSICLLAFFVITWFAIGDWLVAAFTSNSSSARTQIIKEIDEKLQAEEFESYGLENVKIMISDREYKAISAKLERDFINFRDNRVWMNANLILNSNRNQKEKNKVIYITENLSGVDYTSDVLWLEYEDILQDTWKYNNVVVKWKGTIAKFTFREEEEYHTTQFLINFYGTSKELSATVRTYFPKRIVLANGDEVELLASILIPNSNNTESDIELRVESFRRLLQ